MCGVLFSEGEMKVWGVEVSCFAFTTSAKSMDFFYDHYSTFKSTTPEACVRHWDGDQESQGPLLSLVSKNPVEIQTRFCVFLSVEQRQFG